MKPREENDPLLAEASPFFERRLYIDVGKEVGSFRDQEIPLGLESPWLTDEILTKPLIDNEAWTGSSEQVDFRDRVLSAHIERTRKRRGEPKRDLRRDELLSVRGTDIDMRADAAEAASRLIEAANTALAEAKNAGDPDALRTIRISGTSGYRGSDHQRRLWIKYFGGYYDRTREAREALPSGPHSSAAVTYMLETFGIPKRIAAPGYSNHQAGIAIDLWQERTPRFEIRNSSDSKWRRKWRNSWFHKWLLKENHAATFGFVPYVNEEWHWEFKPSAAAKLQTSELLDESESQFVAESFDEMSADDDPSSETEQPADDEEFDDEESPFLSSELLDQDEYSEPDESEETVGPAESGLLSFTARTLPVKVAVLMTRAARQASQVEVLLFAHGLDVCKPVLKQRPVSFITKEPLALGDLAEASGRPIVLIVPFLDWEHLSQNRMMFGRKWHSLARPENLNGVIAETLEKVAALTRTGSAPALSRLILAGHSRAFGFFDALAKDHANPQMSKGALGRLSHVWALDTTYTSPVADWMEWLRSRNDLRMAVIYRDGEPWNSTTMKKRRLATGRHGNEFLAEKGSGNGRLSVKPVPFREVTHCALPKKYLPDLLAALPAISTRAEKELDVEPDDAEIESLMEEFSTEAETLADDEETEDQYAESERWDDEADESETPDEEETSLESFGAFAEDEEDEEWEATGSEETEDDELSAGEESEDEEFAPEEVSYDSDQAFESEVLKASGLTPAELKAVRITSTFETGRRGGFFGLSGNFDGQGLSFGLVNWTIGTGSLQPLLRDFAAQEPARWKTIFGTRAETFSALITPKGKAAVAAQLRFAIGEMNVSTTVDGKRKWSIKEPWISYFKALSEDPAFQRIQVRYVRDLLDRAEYFCQYFGLKSERAFVYMFDAVSSHGKWWLTKKWGGVEKRRELFRSRLTTLESTYGKGSVPEREILLAIADVLADTSNPRWSENVRRRKRWFVNGEHPRAKELKDLAPRDVPYLTSASAVGPPPKPGPTSPPRKKPAATKASTPGSGSMSVAKRAELITAAITQATAAGEKEDRAAIAATLKAHGTDPSSWFSDIAPDATFLGRRIRASLGGKAPGVHRELLAKLEEAERTLLDKYPGRTKEQLGKDLGIKDIGGLRPPKKATGGTKPSHHCFGLAIDINPVNNPFVGNKKPKEGVARYDEFLNNRSPRIIERAMSLLHGMRFNVEKPLPTHAGLAGTEESWKIHHDASEALAEYLRLADDIDGQRVRELVAGVQSRGDAESLAWWKRRITTDRSVIKDWDFKNAPEKQGYMDLPRDLVVALVGAGLRWGGQFPKAKDIMHFDLTTGTIRR